MYTKKQPVDHCSRSTVFELIGDWVFGCFIAVSSEEGGAGKVLKRAACVTEISKMEEQAHRENGCKGILCHC